MTDNGAADRANTLLRHARGVLLSQPKGTKQEWGTDLHARVEAAKDDNLAAEEHAKLITKLGDYVSGVKANDEKQERQTRLVSYHGKPLTATLSVRNQDGSTQLMLWIEASPRQFMDAVLREQSVVDGRRDSNVVRFGLVKKMQADESLMKLKTLGAVCKTLKVDPDTLGLDELASDEAAS